MSESVESFILLKGRTFGYSEVADVRYPAGTVCHLREIVSGDKFTVAYGNVDPTIEFEAVCSARSCSEVDLGKAGIFFLANGMGQSWLFSNEISDEVFGKAARLWYLSRVEEILGRCS